MAVALFRLKNAVNLASTRGRCEKGGLYMVVVVLNIVVGVLLALGGIQEVVVRGILGGESLPFLVGTIGTAVAGLLSLSGVALWRNWRSARALTLLACVLVAAFCVLAAMPPRYVGILALLLGVGYPALVIAYLLRSGGQEAHAS